MEDIDNFYKSIDNFYWMQLFHEIIEKESEEKEESLVGKLVLSSTNIVKKITNAYKDQHGNIYVLLEGFVQVVKYADITFLTEID